MATHPRAGGRGLADGAQAPVRGAGGRPRARGRRRGRRRQARPSSCASALRPDVVTLDMMLPVMSGLAATEYIMAHCPTPILIVSASTNRGELFKTYDALAAGAVDVLEKPRGDEADEDWERRLRRRGQAGLADPRHHPPARATRRARPARPRATAARRRLGRRGRGGLRAGRASARRPAGRARSSRSCARCRRVSAADPARAAHRRALRAGASPTGSTARPRIASRYARRRRAAASRPAAGS